MEPVALESHDGAAAAITAFTFLIWRQSSRRSAHLQRYHGWTPFLERLSSQFTKQQSIRVGAVDTLATGVRGCGREFPWLHGVYYGPSVGRIYRNKGQPCRCFFHLLVRWVLTQPFTLPFTYSLHIQAPFCNKVSLDTTMR